VPRAALIAVVVLVLLLGGALLARMLGASTTERNAVIDIVKAQSVGDELGVVDRIRGCRADPGCVARTRAQVRRLRSRERFRVLRIDGTSGPALGAGTATARVAWRAGDRLPVVQCVKVRRGGDVVGGFDVRVLALSAPIGREASC
jgi:hypothetical protein